MMNPRRAMAAWVCCAFLLGAGFAGQVRNVRVDFKETTLKNGLRVITVEDHTAPVVAICVTYNVGSRDERKGRTGFAHLFEHMMFKGSKNVGPGEHFVLIFNNGGTMNGTTNEDRTNYFEAVPSNQLDMILYLEADRMRGLEITKESLDNQRNAVQEERRQGLDNQPYGKSWEKMQETLYDNFAYKHSVIGSMEDLNAATVEDVRQFFDTYYTPNNAVLTLVGDFDTADAIARVKKYFEDIPRGPEPPKVDMTEPEQKEERRVKVDDRLARLIQVNIAFKAVPGNTADFYPLYVASTALTGGQSSRLYQKLVKEKELLTSIGGFLDEKRGPGALYIIATLRPGTKPEEVEQLIYEEIGRVEKEPLAAWELEKAKNSIRRGVINGLRSSLSRAVTLGQYAVYYDNPNLLNTRLSKIQEVKTDDVIRVAGKYLRSTNRTVVTTYPETKSVAGSGAQK